MECNKGFALLRCISNNICLPLRHFIPIWVFGMKHATDSNSESFGLLMGFAKPVMPPGRRKGLVESVTCPGWSLQRFVPGEVCYDSSRCFGLAVGSATQHSGAQPVLMGCAARCSCASDWRSEARPAKIRLLPALPCIWQRNPWARVMFASLAPISALCCPMLALYWPCVSPMLALVRLCWFKLALGWPKSALCWPKLALSCPYVGPP